MSDGAGVGEWVEELVTFPCSMVDRIVPSTQPEHVTDVQQDCGYTDLRQGRMPHHLALTVAAWLSCVAPPDGFDPGRLAAEIKDPAIPGLSELAAAAASGQDLAAEVFRGGISPEELGQEHQFVARVGELIDLIQSHGISRTLANVAADHPDPTSRPA